LAGQFKILDLRSSLRLDLMYRFSELRKRERIGGGGWKGRRWPPIALGGAGEGEAACTGITILNGGCPPFSQFQGMSETLIQLANEHGREPTNLAKEDTALNSRKFIALDHRRDF